MITSLVIFHVFLIFIAAGFGAKHNSDQGQGFFGVAKVEV